MLSGWHVDSWHDGLQPKWLMGGEFVLALLFPLLCDIVPLPFWAAQYEKVEMLMAELKRAGLVPTGYCHSVRIEALVQQFKADGAVEALAEMVRAGKWLMS